MTKSTITRERLQEIAEDGFLKHGETKVLARMALSALDSAPHTDDELSNLLWYSQEATCHSDPNYYCEFQRLATPGLIAGITRELQERRKADSEPVAWLLSGGGTKNVVCFDSGNAYADPLREVTPLYRHAQPAPVVPDEMLCEFYEVDSWPDLIRELVKHVEQLQDSARRNVKPWEDTFPETLLPAYIERVKQADDACRAAMLAAAPQSPGSEPATVPGKWIPVSERIPEDRKQVILWDAEIGEVTSGHYSHKTQTFYHCGDAIENEITHWMPTPAAPQEVK